MIKRKPQRFKPFSFDPEIFFHDFKRFFSFLFLGSIYKRRSTHAEGNWFFRQIWKFRQRSLCHWDRICRKVKVRKLDHCLMKEKSMKSLRMSINPQNNGLNFSTEPCPKHRKFQIYWLLQFLGCREVICGRFWIEKNFFKYKTTDASIKRLFVGALKSQSNSLLQNTLRSRSRANRFDNIRKVSTTSFIFISLVEFLFWSQSSRARGMMNLQAALFDVGKLLRIAL